MQLRVSTVIFKITQKPAQREYDCVEYDIKKTNETKTSYELNFWKTPRGLFLEVMLENKTGRVWF